MNVKIERVRHNPVLGPRHLDNMLIGLGDMVDGLILFVTLGRFCTNLSMVAATRKMEKLRYAYARIS